MVSVPVAAAVLGGGQRSRLLLLREQGLFPFLSSPDHCRGYVGFPPSQGSFRADGQALASPPKACCSPLAGAGGLFARYGGQGTASY